MFCSSICAVLDTYAFLSAGTQKKKRLHSRRFWFCLGLYKSFLRGAGGEVPFASLRAGELSAKLTERGPHPHIYALNTTVAIWK